MENNQVLLWLQVAVLAILVYMLVTYKSCVCGQKEHMKNNNPGVQFTYPGEVNDRVNRLNMEGGMYQV